MAAWLRILANPRILKRFLGTRAGKKAVLKYGSMLLKSKMIRNAIQRFMGGIGKSLTGDKEYKKNEKEYTRLLQRMEKLESQLESVRDNNEKISELTFALGRTVVEMQRLLTQMQSLYQQRVQQAQVSMTAARTR